MNVKQRIKVNLFTKESGNYTIEDDMQFPAIENQIIQSFSTTSGVNQLPVAEIIFNPTIKFPNLISLRSGDKIDILVKEENTNYIKMFSGEFSSVKIKNNKEKVELKANCISHFHKLQEVRLNYLDFIDTKDGFKEIIIRILEVCKIKGKVFISSNIGNTYKITPFNSFPALSFINAIAYNLDIVYDFRSGEDIHFSRRKDVLNIMNSSTPIVIREQDIISSEFSQ